MEGSFDVLAYNNSAIYYTLHVLTPTYYYRWSKVPVGHISSRSSLTAGDFMEGAISCDASAQAIGVNARCKPHFF